MWLTFHHIDYLTISEEEEEDLFEDVLENKVLVVVADVMDVGLDEVVKGYFPFVKLVVKLVNVIYLLL